MQETQPTQPRKRGKLFKLGVSLASLVVACALGEGVARLCGCELPPEPRSLPTEGDPDVHYRPRENWRGPHIHTERRGEEEVIEHPVQAHTNRYGHRSRDFERVKEAGEFRIAGVGDSLMFGPGVEDGSIFMHLLQDYYDENVPEVGEVLVINGAFNGYHCPEYLKWARTQVPRFQADVLLLSLFTGNDHEVNPTNSFVQVTPWKPLRDYSALANCIDELHREWKFSRISKSDRDKYEGKQAYIMTSEETQDAWDRALERLAQIHEVVESHGTQLVVLLLPIKAWSDPPVDDPATPDVDESQPEFEPHYMNLRARIEALGIPLIDGLPYLRHAGEAAWLPYDAGHLDVEGHKQIARALVTELREKGIVR